MKEVSIKLTKKDFDFKFKQYEGMTFNAYIDENCDVIKYKITKEDVLKEFGNTHIKDETMLYIPQIEAYIDLKTLK